MGADQPEVQMLQRPDRTAPTPGAEDGGDIRASEQPVQIRGPDFRRTGVVPVPVQDMLGQHRMIAFRSQGRQSPLQPLWRHGRGEGDDTDPAAGWARRGPWTSYRDQVCRVSGFEQGWTGCTG